MEDKDIPRVRPEDHDDGPAVRRVLVGAFPTPEEADLMERLRNDDDVVNSSVVEIDDEVVAHAALSQARIAEAPLLVLAPVAVDPDYQNRGLGTLVTAHVLATTGDQPVSVLGEPVYYGRFGFEDADPHGITVGFPIEPGALQILRPGTLPQGELIYAPAFFPA